MTRSRLLLVLGIGVGAGAVGVVLLIAAVFVRLQFGPLSLEAAGPRINALIESRLPDHDVGFGNLSLGVGGLRLVELRASDVFIASRDETFEARAPSADLSFGLISLALGSPEIIAVHIDRPDVRLAVETDGTPPAEKKPPSGSELLAGLSEALTAGGQLASQVPASLDRVVVQNARLQLQTGMSEDLAVESANLELRRRGSSVVADADFQLAGTSGPATFEIGLTHRPVDSTGELTLATRDLNLAELPITKDIAPNLDAPLAARATFDLDLGAPALSGDFEVDAGPGTVALSLADKPIELASVQVRGRIPDAQSFEIGSAVVTLSNANGAGDTTLTASGRLATVESGVDADIDLAVANLVLTEVLARWPSTVFPEGRAWLTENLHGGAIESADIKAALTMPDGAFAAVEPEEIVATVTYAGLELTQLDGPVGGNIDVAFEFRGEEVEGEFEAAAGPGVLDVPVFENPVSFAAARLRGAVPDTSTLRIETAEIVLRGPTGAQPGPTEQADAPSADTTITAGGLFTETDGDLSAQVELAVANLEVLDLPAYWPPLAATNGRAWVAENMHGGTIDTGAFEIALVAPNGETDAIALTELNGSFSYRDLDVTYMEGPPPVTGITGTARLDHDRLTFEASTGTSVGLRVRSAKVALQDLFDDLPTLSVLGSITGDLGTGLSLYSQVSPAVGNIPDIDGGELTVELDVALPLLNDLPFDAVEIAATGRIVDARMPAIIGDLNAEAGDFDLAITGAETTVSGQAELAGAPAQITWTEVSSNGAVPGTRLVGEVSAFGPGFLRSLGIEADAVFDGVGSVTFDVEANPAGDGQAVLELGLDDAQLSLTDLAWQKPAGQPGEARVVISLAEWAPDAITTLSVNAGDLQAEGQAKFDESGDIERAEFKRASVGRTEVSDLRISQEGEGVSVVVGAGTIDASPLLGGALDEVATDTTIEPGPEAESERPHFALRTVFPLERVYVGEDDFLTNVHVEVQQTERGIELVDIRGTIPQSVNARSDSDPDQLQSVETEAEADEPGESRLLVRFAPLADGLYELAVTTDDAGGVLRTFGILTTIEGGTLTIAGATEEMDPTSPIAATIEARRFRVVEAPGFARLLTAVSVPGAVNLLKSGLTFQRLSGGLRLVDGEVLELVEVRANASQLGMSANGTIDIGAGMLDVSGVTVPVRAVNALPGKIPLLGSVLAGRDREGMFAVPYAVSGPFGDAEITVRPSSTLTPGILRDLFGRSAAE